MLFFLQKSIEICYKAILLSIRCRRAGEHRVKFLTSSFIIDLLMNQSRG